MKKSDEIVETRLRMKRSEREILKESAKHDGRSMSRQLGHILKWYHQNSQHAKRD